MKPNYKEVKNHIHNTLGITREDILDIIQQFVEEQIELKLNNRDIKELFENCMDKSIERGLNRVLNSGGNISTLRGKVTSLLNTELTRQLAEKISINIALK